MTHPHLRILIAVLPLALALSALSLLHWSEPARTVSADPGSPECTAGAQCELVAALQQSSAEQELADKYVPIVLMKAQEEPCDGAGDPFAPVEVETVLGNPDVVLLKAGDAEVMISAPRPADLFGLGEGYYLDLPNDPKSAACHYEDDFRALEPSVSNVTYAHIVRERGEPGLALQYWFYYYFNDWNNNHESDWEMIQLLFDAETVEEALDESPVQVGYSQHGSGEYTDWDGDKLEREGDHPLVYVASGSQSNQYEAKTYLGRAEEAGVGFGCDDATGPSRRVEVTARVVPTTVDAADDEFAWINYEGRWGQQLSGEFNGPTGPNTKKQWTRPFTWQEELRESNVEVPGGDTLGPSPVNAFCGVVAFVSNNLLGFIADRPWLSLIGLLTVVGAGVTTAARTSYELVPEPLRRRRKLGQILRTAFAIVRRRFGLFLLLSAAFVPAGMIATGLEALIVRNPPVGPMLEVAEPPTWASLLISATIGAAVFGVAYLVAITGITAALSEVERDGQVSVGDAYKTLLRRAPDLAIARLRAVAIVILLGISIVGIPWAVRQNVRWLFLEQAILLDGCDRKSARAASEQTVDGAWWRAFAISLLLLTCGIVAGPLITTPLLLFTATPLELLNAISSLIYMIVVPIVAVGLTLLYFDLKALDDPA